MKFCLFCGAPMIEKTRGRGFVTYGCYRGCQYYTSEEDVRQAADPPKREEAVSNAC